MAELFGKNYAKSVAVPSQKIPPGDVNGQIMHAHDEIDFTAAAVADTVKLFKIPAGAKLLSALIKHSALGAAAAAEIGWEAGAQGLEAADPNGILVSTANNLAVAAVKPLDIVGVQKEFAEEVQVTATLTGAVTTPGRLAVSVQYILV